MNGEKAYEQFEKQQRQSRFNYFPNHLSDTFNAAEDESLQSGSKNISFIFLECVVTSNYPGKGCRLPKEIWAV